MMNRRRCLYIPPAILIVLIYASCGEKETAYKSDTAWISKDNLSAREIIDSVMSDIGQTKSFKYTSANSANVNFYGGQNTNTFLFDKKGNAFSSRNREQNFRIDGQMYTRKIGLKEEGLVATVISDILDKSTLDKEYFERNIPYVKQNAVVNIKMLENCRIKTSVSGNTLTVKTTDVENTGAKDKKYMTDITITYTPHKELINKATYIKDGKTITATYSFFFDTDEKVELPHLMKLGTILSLEK